MIALALLLAGGPAPPAPADLARTIASLPDADRKAAVGALDEKGRAALYRAMTQETYVALGKKALTGFGVYRTRLVKQERMGERLPAPDVIDMTVRESPQALRLDFVGGPHKGRRLLYNVEVRPREMLVKESGILGFSSFWIDLDSGLARRDTGHRVTECGYGPLFALMTSDLEKARAAGGYRRTDEGFDPGGRWCLSLGAPAGAASLYAERLRFCVDAAVGVPLLVEVFDKKGLRERFDYQELRPGQTVSSTFFTPAGAGL